MQILVFFVFLLVSSIFSFVAFSQFYFFYLGQMIVFFIILVAGDEVAIGLAIIVLMYQRLATVQADELKEMKW